MSIYFHYYLPLEKDRAFHLNKHNLTSLKYALCQVWLKLAQWFLRERFLNLFNVFTLFHYYLPLEKDGALHLDKLESPSPKDALWQIWLKLAQWFLRRRWKCEKFTDRRTDDGQQVIRKAHLNFQLRWAKNRMPQQVPDFMVFILKLSWLILHGTELKFKDYNSYYVSVFLLWGKDIYFALEMGSMNRKSRMIRVRFCTWGTWIKLW